MNHKATKSKTNTGTTALEWSVEKQPPGGFKALLQQVNFTLSPDATLTTEIHKIFLSFKCEQSGINELELTWRSCDFRYISSSLVIKFYVICFSMLIN